MRTPGFLLSLVLDLRAHIPNQRDFGTGPSNTSYGTPLARAIAALLVTVAFLSAVLWIAVRLVTGYF